MNEQNEKQEAPAWLAARAMNSPIQSTASLLIYSAGRLDPTIDTVALMNEWLEKWLQQNQNRGKS